jgi:hypothetical protein
MEHHGSNSKSRWSSWHRDYHKVQSLSTSMDTSQISIVPTKNKAWLKSSSITHPSLTLTKIHPSPTSARLLSTHCDDNNAPAATLDWKVWRLNQQLRPKHCHHKRRADHVSVDFQHKWEIENGKLCWLGKFHYYNSKTHIASTVNEDEGRNHNSNTEDL